MSRPLRINQSSGWYHVTARGNAGEEIHLNDEDREHFRDRYGDRGRDMVLWLARQRSGLTLEELGRAIGGLDYRSVSSAICRMNRDLNANRKMRHFVNKAMSHLQNNEI